MNDRQPKPPHNFLGWPNLGGWLAMLNAAFWLFAAAVGPRVHVHSQAVDILFAIAVLVLSLPVAWPFVFPSTCGGMTESDLVVRAVAIGVNAFAWGYGVAWLYRRSFHVQFSLQTLLAVVTAAAILLGLLRWVMG